MVDRPGYTARMETTTVNNWTITGYDIASGPCIPCDRCTRPIRYVVTITNLVTGERNQIGTGCAVKFGFPSREVNDYANRADKLTTEISEDELATLVEWQQAADALGPLAPWSKIAGLLEDIETGRYVNRYRIERALAVAAVPPVAEETEEYLYLADLDGIWVAATRYGMKWGILDGRGDNIVEWVPYMPVRPSTLAKRGYQEVVGVRVVGDWNASAFAPLALELADA